MPYRFDEFSRRILHGFESPSNDESHEQFAFLSLCFSLFLHGWYWYTVPQGRFFVWTLAGVTFSSCIDLSFFILLSLFDDLVLHEWNGLDCYYYDVMVCKRVFLLLLCFCFCFCLLSFYYLPRVKPGNYSICLCRSVWDMAFFLSYTLRQSSQVKLTCSFYLIDWLANGLHACGQRRRQLVGWLISWLMMFLTMVLMLIRSTYLLTYFLDLDLVRSLIWIHSLCPR